MSTEWKLVPVEPTPAMCLAGAGAMDERARNRAARYAIRDSWAAMIDAAPQPPAEAAQPSAHSRGASPTTGMNLGQRIAHVGARVTDDGRVEFGSVMAVDALISHVLRDLPPAPGEAAPYDETLRPFLALMRKELSANARKGDRLGWLSMSPDQCLLEIYWHVAKLAAAVKVRDRERIAEHSADVANMAMMQADLFGLLAQLPPPPSMQTAEDAGEVKA